MGLSDGEVKVYSNLLDFGEQTVQEINEKLRIERRNIYDILNKLIERGLVSFIVNNKKKSFKVTSPKMILSYLEEKEKDISNIKNEVNSQMIQLEESYSKAKSETNAQIFRGKEGMKAVWNDFLEADEMHWIGSGRYIATHLPNFFKVWNRKRMSKGIMWKNLMRGDMRGEETYELETKKYLPEEFTSNPTVIGIYGNKVVNLLFFEEYFAIVIENKKLADSYRNYHKYLWDNVAKK